MILTVTPNIALDITYRVPELIPCDSHRVYDVAQRAGGKGVNVARVLHQLGHSAEIIGFSGGYTGRAITEDLVSSALVHQLVPISGESRRSVAIVDQKAGDTTIFNEVGPQVTSAEWAELEALVGSLLPMAATLVVAGSLPRGVPTDAGARLVRLAHDSGIPVIADLSGEALVLAAVAGADVIKPNSAELLEATGEANPLRAAEQLRERGAGVVVVSQGPAGLVAVSDSGVFRAWQDEFIRGNPTGAGDSAVAALALGFATDQTWPERLMNAVAISAAAVAAPRAGEYDSDVYARLRKHVQWEELDAASFDK